MALVDNEPTVDENMKPKLRELFHHYLMNPYSAKAADPDIAGQTQADANAESDAETEIIDIHTEEEASNDDSDDDDDDDDNNAAMLVTT